LKKHIEQKDEEGGSSHVSKKRVGVLEGGRTLMHRLILSICLRGGGLERAKKKKKKRKGGNKGSRSRGINLQKE